MHVGTSATLLTRSEIAALNIKYRRYFYCVWFLGTFAWSRKALLVCPVGICQSGSHWTDLREIWYWGVPWKSVEIIQIWLKSGRNIRHFTWGTQERFIVPGDIKSLQKHFCTDLSIFICWQWPVGNSTQRTQCGFSIATMVTRTLPVLFPLITRFVW